jgi:hypothetical protein
MKVIAFFHVLTFLLFFPNPLLKAQTYHPMAVEGAHWVIGSDQFVTPWLDGKFSLSVRGDSTLNEKVYKKVYKDFFEFDAERKIFYNNIIRSSLYALMRDDTLERKVYAITGPTFYENCPKSEEYLLFDFSVEKRDTLQWCSLTGLRFDLDSIQRVDSTQIAYSYQTDEKRNTLYTIFGVAAYLDGSVIEQTVPIIEGFGYENYGPFIEGTTLLDYCIGTNAECGFITGTENRA